MEYLRKYREIVLHQYVIAHVTSLRKNKFTWGVVFAQFCICSILKVGM